MKRLLSVVSVFFLMSLFFIGCSEEADSESESRPQGTKVVSQSFPRENKIYIDSVPEGAKVYLIRENGEDKLLGTTPLVIESSRCPGMTFWISMDMEEYLEKVAVIPEMKEWIAGFESDRHFRYISPGTQRYFDFETAVSRTVMGASGELVAVGPVYKMNWPDKNRVCVLFIPKEKRVSLFYPLMPPPGTFGSLRGRWYDVLRQEHHFSEEQVKEAMGTITRCGKYRARVRDPFKENIAQEFSITVQGGNNDMIVTTVREIRVISGYDDTLFGH